MCKSTLWVTWGLGLKVGLEANPTLAPRWSFFNPLRGEGLNVSGTEMRPGGTVSTSPLYHICSTWLLLQPCHSSQDPSPFPNSSHSSLPKLDSFSYLQSLAPFTQNPDSNPTLKRVLLAHFPLPTTLSSSYHYSISSSLRGSSFLTFLHLLP